MSYTTTTTLALQKAVVGSNQAFETASINSNWDKVDANASSVASSISTANSNISSLTSTVSTLSGTTVPALAARVTTLENEGALSSKSASYTLASTDANQLLAFTGTAAQTVTVGALGVNGDRVDVLRNGTGAVTFAAGAGVTLQSKNGLLSISTQFGAATVIRISATVYQVVGDLA